MLLLGVAIRWRATVVGVVTAALGIMFPLVLITFGQAGWAIAQAGGGAAARRPHRTFDAIADKRVPFVVKLAGQSQEVAHTAPVDLLRVHDQTLEILAGRVVTTSDLVAGIGR